MNDLATPSADDVRRGGTWLAGLPKPLAFVFPGGGALGAYQAGVLAALGDAGVAPDLLVGVSAGSVNAALAAWHPGPDGAGHIRDVWLAMRRRDLLRVHPGRIALALTGRRPSLVDNRHGAAWLMRHFGRRNIEDAPLPLAVVATDLATGYPHAFRSGPVASAILASTAFPGAYPPVERDGRTYVDGGVVDDVPLDIAAGVGARTALVVPVPDLNRDGPVPHKAIDILLRAATFGVEAHGRTLLAHPPDGLQVIVAPPSTTPLMTFSIGATSHLIDEATTTTRRWLARLGTPDASAPDPQPPSRRSAAEPQPPIRGRGVNR